jgi:hypothetical protein
MENENPPLTIIINKIRIQTNIIISRIEVIVSFFLLCFKPLIVPYYLNLSVDISLVWRKLHDTFIYPPGII